MEVAVKRPRPLATASILLACVLATASGCCRQFALQGSWCFNWWHGGCENCDSCRARIFPRNMSTDDCPTCGERGCTRACCRAAKTGCTACGGPFPRIARAFGWGCRDPRVPRHHHQAKRYPAYPPSGPGDGAMDMWTTEGPGYFHPVPTRPVFGPRPTPADALPNSDEDPSDSGLESIPLRDLPRNLDTPSDPRNLIPEPESLESTPEDFPPDAGSSSVKKKYTVQQTGWRPRKQF